MHDVEGSASGASLVPLPGSAIALDDDRHVARTRLVRFGLIAAANLDRGGRIAVAALLSDGIVAARLDSEMRK
jgi:hypothetical protein